MPKNKEKREKRGGVVMSTAIICILLIVIAIFSIKSYMKKLSHGCCGGGDTERKVKVSDKNISHYPYHKKIQIEGMTCKNCAMRIENAFNNEDGCYAIVHLKQKNADLYLKNSCTDEEIEQLIQKIGYQAIGIQDLS